jgi:uncharacterized membrane protein (DUF373 family)
MAEDRLRRHFDDYLGKTEIVIYTVLAVMLAIAAFLTIATACQILWIGLNHWTVAAQTLKVRNQLLIVLMLVEILHTVRISIRSHVLVTEPFLVVGLIASIRRSLVITLEAATLTKDGAWATEGSRGIFHSSMIELGLLAVLESSSHIATQIDGRSGGFCDVARCPVTGRIVHLDSDHVGIVLIRLAMNDAGA